MAGRTAARPNFSARDLSTVGTIYDVLQEKHPKVEDRKGREREVTQEGALP